MINNNNNTNKMMSWAKIVKNESNITPIDTPSPSPDSIQNIAQSEEIDDNKTKSKRVRIKSDTRRSKRDTTLEQRTLEQTIIDEELNKRVELATTLANKARDKWLSTVGDIDCDARIIEGMIADDSIAIKLAEASKIYETAYNLSFNKPEVENKNIIINNQPTIYEDYSSDDDSVSDDEIVEARSQKLTDPYQLNNYEIDISSNNDDWDKVPSKVKILDLAKKQQFKKNYKKPEQKSDTISTNENRSSELKIPKELLSAKILEGKQILMNEIISKKLISFLKEKLITGKWVDYKVEINTEGNNDILCTVSHNEHTLPILKSVFLNNKSIIYDISKNLEKDVYTDTDGKKAYIRITNTNFKSTIHFHPWLNNRK